MTTVHKAEQKESPMEVQNAALALAEYTFDEAGKETVIAKRNRWSIGERLLDAALDVCVHVETANAMRLEIPDEAADRIIAQDKAIASVCRIKTLVQIARHRLMFPYQKHVYWTRLCTTAIKLLYGWKESDRLRKRKPKKQEEDF